MATISTSYGTTTSGTGGIHSLATSSTWVAGYEWFVVDNSSELALDYRHDGKIRVGTTPTINTEIRIYLVASNDGTNWPDVFDGTASAETVTSSGVGSGFLKLVATLRVDATTSDRDYPYEFKASDAFGSVLPKKYAVFVAHNTGVNLNSTSTEQTYRYTPIKFTSA